GFCRLPESGKQHRMPSDFPTERSTMLCTTFRFSRGLLRIFAVALLLSSADAAQVNWQTDIEQSLAAANASGRLVLMKFTADWCGYCRKMERETFTRPNVAELVNSQFVAVLVDADQHKDLVRHLKISGLPAMLVVSPDMVILNRITGYQTEEKLIPQLRALLAQHGSAAAAGQFAVQSSNMSTGGMSGSPAAAPSGSPSAGFAPAPAQTAAVSQSRPVSTQSAVTAPAPQAATASPANPFDSQFRPQRAEGSQNPGPFYVADAADVQDDRAGMFEEVEVSDDFTDDAANPAAPAQTAEAAFGNSEDLRNIQQPAFGGLCLPSVTETRSLVSGSPEFALTYHGKILYFANARQMQKFRTDPARYWPMLDGTCPVALVEHERTVEGQLEYAAVFRGKVWVTCNAEALQMFITAPAQYVDAVREQ
ncbi:MAG: thioredoxin family protein, partial [Planctomycetaceae bacterium]|nr:thioredoxin family protein [Planctomycetaceae bacterium]